MDIFTIIMAIAAAWVYLFFAAFTYHLAEKDDEKNRRVDDPGVYWFWGIFWPFALTVYAIWLFVKWLIYKWLIISALRAGKAFANWLGMNF